MELEMTDYPAGYFTSAAYAASNRGYELRAGAAGARRVQAHPWNWYVWQMSDGWWHISLMTNREV
jgi:hypothetical protein